MKYILMTIGIAAADRFTKSAADEKIQLDKDIKDDKRIGLANIRNHGAAMGLFAARPRLLTAMTLIACLDISRVFYGIHKEGKLDEAYKFSMACIAGGAIGNVGDRLRQGYVTDFISVRIGKGTRIFNLADVFVALGAIIFAVKKLTDR